MKKGIMAVMLVIFIIGFIGCVTYNHTQSIRNETGFTVKEVYIRDTSTTDWVSVRSSNAYWKGDMNNGTQIVFFNGYSGGLIESSTPKAMGNKDIAIKDSNGLLYMKNNVPITFTTEKLTLVSGEVLTKSTPITFTVQDRLPILFLVNQTGYSLTLTDPVQISINNRERAQFQPMETNQNIDVTYRINQAQYTEQVTMKNEDTTVALTKRPPTLTIVNNVGATINTIWMRIPGSPTWTGGNIVIRGDTVHLTEAGKAQAGDISTSIVNRDNMKIWLGNINLTGNIFDIRIDDVNGGGYVKSNVQVTNDMTLTFTQTDKR